MYLATSKGLTHRSLLNMTEKKRYLKLGAGTVNPCLFWFLGECKCRLSPFPSNDTLSYGRLIALSPYLIVKKKFQNATLHQKTPAIPNLRYSKPFKIEPNRAAIALMREF